METYEVRIYDDGSLFAKPNRLSGDPITDAKVVETLYITAAGPEHALNAFVSQRGTLSCTIRPS